MKYIIAIDPGDVHVGIATLVRPSGLRHTEELAPLEACEMVDREFGSLADRVQCILVVEEFRLYGDKAKDQVGSAMPTSQMIGALKWIARTRGAEVVEQGAGIKKPTRAQLVPRGIRQWGKGGHARDAELHLIHYCLKEGLWPES